MGGPIGLDFGAVMAMATARRVDLELLSDVLPTAEQAILRAFDDEGGDDTPGRDG